MRPPERERQTASAAHRPDRNLVSCKETAIGSTSIRVVRRSGSLNETQISHLYHRLRGDAGDGAPEPDRAALEAFSREQEDQFEALSGRRYRHEEQARARLLTEGATGQNWYAARGIGTAARQAENEYRRAYDEAAAYLGEDPRLIQGAVRRWNDRARRDRSLSAPAAWRSDMASTLVERGLPTDRASLYGLWRLASAEQPLSRPEQCPDCGQWVASRAANSPHSCPARDVVGPARQPGFAAPDPALVHDHGGLSLPNGLDVRHLLGARTPSTRAEQAMHCHIPIERLPVGNLPPTRQVLEEDVTYGSSDLGAVPTEPDRLFGRIGRRFTGTWPAGEELRRYDIDRVAVQDVPGESGVQGLYVALHPSSTTNLASPASINAPKDPLSVRVVRRADGQVLAEAPLQGYKHRYPGTGRAEDAEFAAQVRKAKAHEVRGLKVARKAAPVVGAVVGGPAGAAVAAGMAEAAGVVSKTVGPLGMVGGEKMADPASRELDPIRDVVLPRWTLSRLELEGADLRIVRPSYEPKAAADRLRRYTREVGASFGHKRNSRAEWELWSDVAAEVLEARHKGEDDGLPLTTRFRVAVDMSMDGDGPRRFVAWSRAQIGAGISDPFRVR